MSVKLSAVVRDIELDTIVSDDDHKDGFVSNMKALAGKRITLVPRFTDKFEWFYGKYGKKGDAFTYHRTWLLDFQNDK